MDAVVFADFLGWNSQEWSDTAGIAGVFFVFFPLLVNILIAYIIAQILGERAENQAYARGERIGDSSG
jgi:hypothetical protein